MHRPAFEKKDVELLFVWIIPSILAVIGVLYWAWQGKLAYLAYLYVMSIVFIGIFVNVATDYLNIWRWKVTFLPRLKWLYRPVVYAIYGNLMYLLGAHLLQAETTLMTVLESGLVIGFVGMMLGVLFDLYTLDVGFISVTHPRFSVQKYGTILALTRYAWKFFGQLSIAVGLAAKVGHYYMYETAAAPMHWLPLGVVAGTVIAAPFVVVAFFNDCRSIPDPKLKLGTPYSHEPVPPTRPWKLGQGKVAEAQ